VCWAHVVEIDVTDEASVNKGVEEALKVADIDVLINNAGIGSIGLQESHTIEDFKKIFDVNVFGVQRMNRAILPHFRKKKSGLLIHISSVLGRFSLPFWGPYCSSKFSLEALVEGYRAELAGFGMEFAVVEPSAFPTDIFSKLLGASDTECNQSYGEFANAPRESLEGLVQIFDGADAPDLQKVADAVLDLIATPKGQRKFRTVVDAMGIGDPIEDINEVVEKSILEINRRLTMEDAA